MTLFKNILISLVVIAIFALHPSLNKGDTPITYLQYLVYGNSINLSYNNLIDKDKIRVEWECENPKLNCLELTIIKNGKKINEIPFEKGNQKLVVYYNNQVVGSLNQNKTTKTQAHQYNVHLNANSKLICFEGKIIGPSPASFSQTIRQPDLTLANL